MASKQKHRTHRYRFTTSLSAGVLLVLVLAYFGGKYHNPMPVAGGVVTAVVFGLIMFVVWSIVAAVRRSNERARERERATARPVGRRGRRYARQGRA